MLKNRNILLGVSGGIAVYKAAANEQARAGRSQCESHHDKIRL